MEENPFLYFYDNINFGYILDDTSYRNILSWGKLPRLVNWCFSIGKYLLYFIITGLLNFKIWSLWIFQISYIKKFNKLLTVYPTIIMCDVLSHTRKYEYKHFDKYTVVCVVYNKSCMKKIIAIT